jgi:hypothetical protein
MDRKTGRQVKRDNKFLGGKAQPEDFKELMTLLSDKARVEGLKDVSYAIANKLSGFEAIPEGLKLEECKKVFKKLMSKHSEDQSKLVKEFTHTQTEGKYYIIEKIRGTPEERKVFEGVVADSKVAGFKFTSDVAMTETHLTLDYTNAGIDGTKTWMIPRSCFFKTEPSCVMVRSTAKKASRILTKGIVKYFDDCTRLLDGMGFHLISENYTAHVANMTNIFHAFKHGPIFLAGHQVDIRKVKLGLTDEKFDKNTALNYNYKDDKIIFLVHKGGETIQLECIAMPREMYLLKCDSHKIYDFTRVFGQKNTMERGLEAQSIESIYQKIKSDMIKLEEELASRSVRSPSEISLSSELTLSSIAETEGSLEDRKALERLTLDA